MLANENSKNLNYDIVIIGAGPAGITLSLQFNKTNLKIALVESGERYFSESSQKYYQGSVKGDFPRKLDEARLSMFGGTTGHWGGSCRSLDKHDFLKWPINKKDLDEHSSETAKIFKIKNSFRNENLNKDLDIIEYQQSKSNFSDDYFPQIKDSTNIHLFLRTTMTEINGENFYTKNVKCYSKDDKNFFKLNGKIFVLATGGIENSRILLLEKSKNKDLFSKNLPIGNYWFEHPFKVLGQAIVDQERLKKNLNSSFDPWVNMFDAGEKSEVYSFAPTHKLINKEKISNSCCWLVTHERSNTNLKNVAKNLLCLSPKVSKKLLSKFEKKLLCGATIYSSWEQEPEISNKIVLTGEKDEFGNNRAMLIYKKSDLVRKTARVMFEKIGEFLIEKNFGRLIGEEFLFEDNIKYVSESGWHHMGGTRMGNDEKNSVVDQNLKIHGSKNIYVIGSSVFPTGGHANPTFTIIQLTLRLKKHFSKKFII